MPSRSCEEISTAASIGPRSDEPQSAFRATGSSPFNGSSRSKTSGDPSMAVPSVNRCRIPCERCSEATSALPVNPTVLRMVSSSGGVDLKDA